MTSAATLWSSKVFLLLFCFLRPLSFPVKPVSSSSCNPSSSDRSSSSISSLVLLSSSDRCLSPTSRSRSPDLGSSSILPLPTPAFAGFCGSLVLLFVDVSRLLIRLLRRRLWPSPSISGSGVCTPASAAAASGADELERRGDLDLVLDLGRLDRGNWELAEAANWWDCVCGKTARAGSVEFGGGGELSMIAITSSSPVYLGLRRRVISRGWRTQRNACAGTTR